MSHIFYLLQEFYLCLESIPFSHIPCAAKGARANSPEIVRNSAPHPLPSRLFLKDLTNGKIPGTPFSERDQTMQPTQWKSWGMSGGLKSGQLMEDHVQQPRNPKTEGRNPNSENGLIRLAAAPPGWLSIRTSACGFLSAFGLRVSGLEWPGPTLEQPWGGGETAEAAPTPRPSPTPRRSGVLMRGRPRCIQEATDKRPGLAGEAQASPCMSASGSDGKGPPFPCPLLQRRRGRHRTSATTIR